MPLNYIDLSKRRLEIYNRFRDETGLTRFEEGSKVRSLLDSIMSAFDQLELRISEDALRTNPLSSSGIYQDAWMDFLGTTKKQSTKAMVRADQKIVRVYVETGTFGDINGGQDIIWEPRQVSFTALNRLFSQGSFEEISVLYFNSEYTILPAGESELWIGIEAEGFGEVYRVEANQLQDHNFTEYLMYPEEVIKVNNVVPITSGYDGDTDAIASAKLMQSSLFRPTTALDKMEMALLEIDDIEDFLVLPKRSGPGTVDIFVDNSFFNISETVIEETRRLLSAYENDGLEIFLNKVPRVGLTVVLSVDFHSEVSEDRQDQILDELRNRIYNTLVLGRIGDTITLSQFARDLYLAFPEVRTFGKENRFFDEVKIYRDSMSGLRVGALVNQSVPLDILNYERMFPEVSFPSPVIVRKKYA